MMNSKSVGVVVAADTATGATSESSFTSTHLITLMWIYQSSDRDNFSTLPLAGSELRMDALHMKCQSQLEQ